MKDIFTVQLVKKELSHSYQMYSVLVKTNKRSSLLHFLKKNGVDASVHFDPPLHKQTYLKNIQQDSLILKNYQEKY